MEKYLKLACDKARNGIKNNEGGPFGACIVKDDSIVSISNNRVLIDNDPTAHAEVNAIREACKKLNTYDLNGCILFTTCEPCPMCLSAIIWANIKDVYYVCTRNDADKVGFRDQMIYDYLDGKNSSLINLKKVDFDECNELFDNYNNTIY